MANKSKSKGKSVQTSSGLPSPLSRRTFLGRMGVSTAVAATACPPSWERKYNLAGARAMNGVGSEHSETVSGPPLRNSTSPFRGK